MAKINFDAATKGNPGISTCAIVIKEDEQHYTYTHELGEMDRMGSMYLCTRTCT